MAPIGVSVSAGGALSGFDGAGMPAGGGAGSAVVLWGAGGRAAGALGAGAGVVADLFCEPSPIATAVPTSNTAATVMMSAAAGNRCQRAANPLRWDVSGVASSVEAGGSGAGSSAAAAATREL